MSLSCYLGSIIPYLALKMSGNTTGWWCGIGGGQSNMFEPDFDDELVM